MAQRKHVFQKTFTFTEQCLQIRINQYRETQAKGPAFYLVLTASNFALYFHGVWKEFSLFAMRSHWIKEELYDN